MRPFEGMKVVDLTHVLAGPFSTYQLALLGADVVKIEAPGLGEYMRRRGADEALSKNLMGDHYLSQNANKRSLVVNLKTSRGQDVVRRLAAGADVVVENYRAGVVDRLNLGYEALAALNPRLVYCSLKAYGATGPKGGLPGWDHNVQAASGLMMTTGTESSAPLKAGAPVIDYASGTMAAFAISAALLQRERTGKGQFIDVSMLDTALMLMSPLVGSCFMTGRAPQPHGNDHDLAAGSCYETADGEHIMLGAIMQGQFETFCRLIGRADLAQDPRFADVREQGPHRAALAAEITVAMKARTADEWEALLGEAVPAVRVRGLDEALGEEQLLSRGVLHTFDEVPGVGADVTVPLAAFTYDHGGPRADAPPPRLDQHTDEVMAEIGFAADEIETLRREGVIGNGGGEVS
ncbi:MAG TPA: CaiB/BaiF CoA-transferase family protein [Rhodospirillales bacterium]|jgi:crotonobetainyl-CoA:carnitine CoA-transferase CaiB-like acyl-CoA transferase|nr:CaiB/BaiF CoA-transferase family protein [Rhodospirillales bacterium]